MELNNWLPYSAIKQREGWEAESHGMGGPCIWVVALVVMQI